MPEQFVIQAQAAIARHRHRKWVPDITETEKGWSCPYADEHADYFWALLFEVFGTRQTAVVTTFMGQLHQIAPTFWKAGVGYWEAEEEALRTMLSILHSLKPQNEAQAAYAAQMVALHITSMKLGKRAAEGDPRAAAVLNKTVRAYGEGLERFERLKGKSGRSHQTIIVKKQTNVQVNHYRGEAENGGQSQATEPAEVIEECRTLPSQGPDGSIMPLPSGKGQTRLSDARRHEQRRS